MKTNYIKIINLNWREKVHTRQFELMLFKAKTLFCHQPPEKLRALLVSCHHHQNPLAFFICGRSPSELRRSQPRPLLSLLPPSHPPQPARRHLPNPAPDV